MSFLQKVDRALARNHGNQSRLCHVSGGSTAIPGNSNRTVSARRCLYRTRWQGLLCCRSGLQVPAISIVEEMAGLELRSCSRLRVDLRNGLQIHRAASQPRIDVYSSVVGQGCTAPDLFLGASLVSPHPGACLSDRVRLALGAGRWTCWHKWNVASEPVSSRCSTATRVRCLFSFTNALLVQFE